jgi:hypothetical protein
MWKAMHSLVDKPTCKSVVHHKRLAGTFVNLKCSVYVTSLDPDRVESVTWQSRWQPVGCGCCLSPRCCIDSPAMNHKRVKGECLGGGKQLIFRQCCLVPYNSKKNRHEARQPLMQIIDSSVVALEGLLPTW